MSELTETSVAEVGAALRERLLECKDVDNVERCAIFQEEDGILRCKATPAKMQELLDDLRAWTEVINEDATGVEVLADVVVSSTILGQARELLEKAGDVVNPQTVEAKAKILATEQWNRDMIAWVERLNRYQQYLDDVYDTNPSAYDSPLGCELIHRTVIDPLLFGWFWEEMPGIMQTSGGLYDVQTRPDWVSPYTLGNQRLAYRAAMQEAAWGLVNDLTTLAPDRDYCTNFPMDPRCWNWRAIGIGAGVVAAGLAGLWAWRTFGSSGETVVIQLETPRGMDLRGQDPATARQARRLASS